MANMLSPLEALSYVQQQGEMGRQRGQQNQLAQLASQSYTAAPDQQQGILGQMAAINPQAAQATQQQFQGQDDRRNRTLANMANLLVNAPAQARPALYQKMLPSLQQFGIQAPTAYDESTAPVIDQTAQALYQAYSGAAGQTPTDVRSFQMMTANLSPEDREKARRVQLGIEGRASSSGFTQLKFTGPDGRERVGVMNGRTGRIDLPDGTSFDPQTGGMAPTQGGQAAPVLPQGGGQQVVEQDAQLANQMIAAGIPADQVDRFLQSRAAQFNGGAQPAAAANNPNAFVGRAPEEQAAATAAAQEGAKIRTQLAYAPDLATAEADAARKKTEATTAAEARAKRFQEESTRARNANDTLDLLNQAESLVKSSTGSGLGAVRDAGAAFVGESTDGANAIAALQPIAAGLVAKVPRMEGPQSDADRMMYERAAGDIANPKIPVPQRLAAINTIRLLNDKYATGGGQAPTAPSQQSGAPVRVQSTADYDALPSGAVFIAPDGTQRRKR